VAQVVIADLGVVRVRLHRLFQLGEALLLVAGLHHLLAVLEGFLAGAAEQHQRAENQ
jgi:hypothetical protein